MALLRACSLQASSVVSIDGLGTLALGFERAQVLLIQMLKVLLLLRMHGGTLDERTRVGHGYTEGRVK